MLCFNSAVDCYMLPPPAARHLKAGGCWLRPCLSTTPCPPLSLSCCVLQAFESLRLLADQVALDEATSSCTTEGVHVEVRVCCTAAICCPCWWCAEN